MSCIVLIHHDPLEQLMLSSLLQQDHDEVLQYSSLTEFLSVWCDQYDLTGIVLDLSLLSLSWWVFHERIQSMARTRDRQIPILGLSSQYGTTDPQKICHEFQIDAYEPFPINPWQFRQSVKSLLGLIEKDLSLSRR